MYIYIVCTPEQKNICFVEAYMIFSDRSMYVGTRLHRILQFNVSFHNLASNANYHDQEARFYSLLNLEVVSKSTETFLLLNRRRLPFSQLHFRKPKYSPLIAV